MNAPFRRAPGRAARLALLAVPLVLAGCEDRRERPADLPPGPYAQADQIPDRYQQRGISAPIYVIESLQDNRVHLIPLERATTQDRYRQGDPVYEFVIREEEFRNAAGTSPVVGAHVRLEMGPTGRPERITVVETAPTGP